MTPTSVNSPSNGAGVVETGADSLETPATLGGVLNKHSALKPGSGSGQTGKKRGPYNKGPRPPADVPDVPAALFTPESFTPVIQLPFAVLNIALKTKSFTLDEVETENLATSGARVANLYAPGWNPKAVALASFGLGFAMVAVGHTLRYLGELDEKRELERKKKAVAETSGGGHAPL